MATEFAKYLAKSMGLSDSQIAVHGLPIRPAFSKRLPARPVSNVNTFCSCLISLSGMHCVVLIAPIGGSALAAQNPLLTGAIAHTGRALLNIRCWCL